MVREPRKNILEVIREVGKYPPDAFQFVQEGLSYTVQHTHGEMNKVQQEIHEYLYRNHLDLDDIETMMADNRLPKELHKLVSEAGGLEMLNRHVSGQSLCWGLRDYALKKWGAMASAVLNHWNIRKTRDFGEIVFALVENDFLQKQSNDSIADFENVFDFDDAFDRAFRIQLAEMNN